MQKRTIIAGQLPVDVLREGKAFIAYCPVLDLPAAGTSYEDALEKFSVVSRAFIEELAKAETLEEYLSEMGWSKVQGRWTPPVLVGHSEKAFSFPLQCPA